MVSGMPMENKPCLVVADDLTGAADTGVQFAIRGRDACLISPEGDRPIDFSRYRTRDVLVVNTRSRGLDAGRASDRIALLLRDGRPDGFRLAYKKIDSTLRGNIGAEIDSLMDATGSSVGFVAPSLPEQHRSVEGGILRVDGKPLALTEAARDAVTPIHESRVPELLRAQSRRKVVWIGLDQVGSTVDALHAEVMRHGSSGNGVLIVFDAATRADLRNIAEAGFRMPQHPLWIGSAGLAGEVAGMLSSDAGRRPSPFGDAGSMRILWVCGSASGVTHGQIRYLEERGSVAAFELYAGMGSTPSGQDAVLRTAERMGRALGQGHVLLKPPHARLEPRDDAPVQTRITEDLGLMTRHALAASGLPVGSLVLVAAGGDTAAAVLQALGAEELRILGQALDGIVVSRLAGGPYDGLRIITKAGAFGQEDAFEKIIGFVAGRPLEPSDTSRARKEDP